MILRTLAVALALLEAAPQPDFTPAPTARTESSAVSRGQAQRTDFVYTLIGGDWTCTTFGGSRLTHHFERMDDARSVQVTTGITFEGKTATLRETYTYSSSAKKWTAVLADGKFRATADEGFGKVWLLTGVDSELGSAVPTRMRYTREDENAFRRDFERSERGAWKNYAGETCRRTPG